MPDDFNILPSDLVTVSRFAANGMAEDARLYIARMIRRYRNTNPSLALELTNLLKDKPTPKYSQFRFENNEDFFVHDNGLPSFLNGPVEYSSDIKPILSDTIQRQLMQVVSEHKIAIELQESGLKPSNSLIFVGPPGVGKTLSAHYLAMQLGLPLYTVDLATVVSSYLGQTGNNLKHALSYAKHNPMVLLLDEIDSLAKTRGDESDVGELKRIVTVLLQEIDQWSSSSVLVAATNHPEIVDRALWRRFDQVVTFQLPDKNQIRLAIELYLTQDQVYFEKYIPVLEILFKDKSFSDIERTILEYRRTLFTNSSSAEELIERAILNTQNWRDRKDIALTLLETSGFSQYKINKITGISRDTLRKYKLN